MSPGPIPRLSIGAVRLQLQEKDAYRMERIYGMFARSLSLPATVDAAKVTTRRPTPLFPETGAVVLLVERRIQVSLISLGE